MSDSQAESRDSIDNLNCTSRHSNASMLSQQPLPPPSPSPTPLPLSSTARSKSISLLQEKPAPNSHHYYHGSNLQQQTFRTPSYSREQQKEATHFYHPYPFRNPEKALSPQQQYHQPKVRKTTAFRSVTSIDDRSSYDYSTYQQQTEKTHNRSISFSSPNALQNQISSTNNWSLAQQPQSTRHSLPYTISNEALNMISPHNSTQRSQNEKPVHSSKKTPSRKNNALQAYISYMTYTDIMRRNRKQQVLQKQLQQLKPLEQQNKVVYETEASHNDSTHVHNSTNNNIVERPLTDFLRMSWRE
ncbi:hypothetical protein BDF20DRAFT_864265 [Mycotypha africana]|uniref:uncharacterized protein n=1 Tax=Mycotypha africana TaxID=64632 RepID=UPI0023005BEA|nr:uncharacterized protein BDF20DRAFT_864265 [Mycotypha africana]KAI8981953.1 hypothetical protein BDF20DRAFT_864265 [Mycotypha africana]